MHNFKLDENNDKQCKFSLIFFDNPLNQYVELTEDLQALEY